MELRRILARNVKRLRKLRDWTQEDLEAAAKVDRGSISAVENSKCSTGIDIIERLASGLGVEPTDLLK